MQTHSVILWIKKDDFSVFKRGLDGAVMYREYNGFIMLIQVGPSKYMNALIRAERLYHATKDWS